MLMSQRPHFENRYYPVLELATYLFIVLLLKVQETSVLNLLTRFPYSRDWHSCVHDPGSYCYTWIIGIKSAMKKQYLTFVREFYNLQSSFTSITSFEPSDHP